MKEKLKSESNPVRLPGYDYSQPGSCFVTICTRDEMSCFGAIYKGETTLSGIGKAAKNCWEAIPQHLLHVRLQNRPTSPNRVRTHETSNNHEKNTDRPPVTQRSQRNFHERNLFNPAELIAVRKYIRNNPLKYTNDN